MYFDFYCHPSKKHKKERFWHIFSPANHHLCCYKIESELTFFSPEVNHHDVTSEDDHLYIMSPCYPGHYAQSCDYTHGTTLEMTFENHLSPSHALLLQATDIDEMSSLCEIEVVDESRVPLYENVCEFLRDQGVNITEGNVTIEFTGNQEPGTRPMFQLLITGSLYLHVYPPPLPHLHVQHDSCIFSTFL